MKKILLLSVFSFMVFILSDNISINELHIENSYQAERNSFYNGTNLRIFPGSYQQIETSAFTHPQYTNIIAASAITDYYAGGYTTGFYISTNSGLNWSGTDNIKTTSGSTITTIGDPYILINNNGYFIMTYIAPSPTAGYDLKIGSSYSTNSGSNWTSTVYIPGVDTADKPISATDNIQGSSYEGRTYIAFDELYNFGEEIKGVFFSYSTNNGISWDTSKRITNVDTNYKYRLISDISVGTDGDVFVLWYSKKSFMGLAKSTNGGENWITNSDTAISTNRTIITQEYENVYLQSVPSMDIDLSEGVRNGWMYTVSVGKNLDSADVILHRSTDSGVTWNYSKRVNSDSTGNVKLQFMPALNVDKYGGVNILYYDARNSNANDSFEVYLSRSTDGGITFNDTKISDHKIKFSEPAVPFFGFNGYIGAYTGLTSGDKKITPVWYDNSTGSYKAFTTNIELLPLYNIKVFPEGFYDNLTGYTNMKDTVKVYLRQNTSPFSIIDSAKGVFDSLNYNSEINFNPELPDGNYYLDIKHRNSIRTWSSVVTGYYFGYPVYYNITNLQSSAYGDNLKAAGTKWGIYSGDVDQNGVIDLDDIVETYNGSNSFLSGYVVEDCNGDSVADLSDVLIVFNNAQLFVTVITP